ncbi:MAG: hypothetical protein AAGD25_41085 [Cyanobacteria bacterium P01_F01_bin.150]
MVYTSQISTHIVNTSLDTIDTVVQQLKETFSHAVARFHYEFGLDSDDEPAIWLWVVFHDEQLEAQWPFENRMAIRQHIRDAFQAAGILHWIYIRFRSDSEDRQATLMDQKGIA